MKSKMLAGRLFRFLKIFFRPSFKISESKQHLGNRVVMTGNMSLLAHDVSSTEIQRTSDVLTDDLSDKTFASLHLPRQILDGLSRAGFVRPSPVQIEAIPAARIGEKKGSK